MSWMVNNTPLWINITWFIWSKTSGWDETVRRQARAFCGLSRWQSTILLILTTVRWQVLVSECVRVCVYTRETTKEREREVEVKRVNRVIANSKRVLFFNQPFTGATSAECSKTLLSSVFSTPYKWPCIGSLNGCRLIHRRDLGRHEGVSTGQMAAR